MTSAKAVKDHQTERLPRETPSAPRANNWLVYTQHMPFTSVALGAKVPQPAGSRGENLIVGPGLLMCGLDSKPSHPRLRLRPLPSCPESQRPECGAGVFSTWASQNDRRR